MSTAPNRLPDPAPASGEAGDDGEDPRERMARRLLPALVHGVNNHTQFLTGLNAVLALSPDGQVLHDRAGDLARTARDVEDAGWLLALIATGNGANLMLARREPRGLGIVAAGVDLALRRDGGARIADCENREWPELAPDVMDGWQLPWAIGSLLLAAGLDQADEDSFEWEFSSGPSSVSTVHFRVPLGLRVEGLVPVLAELLGEPVRLQTEGETLQLSMPRGWLVIPGTDA